MASFACSVNVAPIDAALLMTRVMSCSGGEMRLFLTQDLGRFDVVSAFCSLYYEQF